jgi:hypothetical protein
MLKFKKMKTDAQLSAEIFIFNLGRLWQEAISEHWDEAIYLYEFIKEITDPILLNRYSKSLRKLQIAIEKRDCSAVDKVLKEILKW